MKCKRCGNPQAAYKQRKPKKGYTDESRLAYYNWKRTDYTIKCKKCGEYNEFD